VVDVSILYEKIRIRAEYLVSRHTYHVARQLSRIRPYHNVACNALTQQHITSSPVLCANHFEDMQTAERQCAMPLTSARLANEVIRLKQQSRFGGLRMFQMIPKISCSNKAANFHCEVVVGRHESLVMALLTAPARLQAGTEGRAELMNRVGPRQG
jgi:hypothetical protein